VTICTDGDTGRIEKIYFGKIGHEIIESLIEVIKE
jgi:hypothetical protein